MHLDEEGGVMAGGEDHWREWLRSRLDVNVLAPDDHVCTWGSWQQDFYQSQNPDCKSNIEITGHPRFDFISRSIASSIATMSKRSKPNMATSSSSTQTFHGPITTRA
jgi:hypothetical protein